MKTGIRIILAVLTVVNFAFAQKIDQERMDRDIEIAENALSTIIKQQFDRRNMWLDVKANYTPGFGVTMRLPNDNSSWIYEYNVKGRGGATIIAPPAGGSYSSPVVVYSSGGSDDSNSNNNSYGNGYSKSNGDKLMEKDKDKGKDKNLESRDSARTAFYTAMIKASKDFIADYGDLLSQLTPEEKILITNRGEGGRFYYDYNKNSKRLLVTIEGTKGDIIAFKQGKITRDQMMSKIKVVNTETTNEIETDLELFSSIMSRLYRSDLSKTFYTDENIYYERLKDFGVIYYMSAYSGYEMDRTVTDKDNGRLWRLPTQRLEGLTQEQRDKKVTELYPQFEKELKDNIVEYAQTVKSLKDEEMFVFNIQITKCVGCNIPSSLELSLKNSMVRKLAAGQATKAEVVAAINVKKGPNQ
jgi:hypothetical protein